MVFFAACVCWFPPRASRGFIACSNVRRPTLSPKIPTYEPRGKPSPQRARWWPHSLPPLPDFPPFTPAALFARPASLLLRSLLGPGHSRGRIRPRAMGGLWRGLRALSLRCSAPAGFFRACFPLPRKLAGRRTAGGRVFPAAFRAAARGCGGARGAQAGKMEGRVPARPK